MSTFLPPWHLDRCSHLTIDFESGLKAGGFISQMLQSEYGTPLSPFTDDVAFERKLNDTIQLAFQLTKIDDQEE